MQPNYDALYRALVTSNVDSTNSGKIRVQCPQIAGLAEIRSAEPVNPQMPIPTTGSTVWIGFSGGDITKPFYFTDISYLNLAPDGKSLHMQSLTGTGLTNDAGQLYLTPGSSTAKTGSASAPHVLLTDTANSAPVDLLLSGSAIKTTNAGSPYVWQTPSYQTGWSGNTSFIGINPVRTLQYRKDAEDNTWFQGSFTCGSGAGAVVFQLPGDYYNSSIQEGFVIQEKQVGGTYQVGFGYISLSGNFHVDLAANFTRNSGDTFYVNAKIPIGNLS